jgi:hypothetical protein
MFDLADRLVGIYKTDNCTKSVTINPPRAFGVTGQQNLHGTMIFLEMLNTWQPSCLSTYSTGIPVALYPCYYIDVDILSYN